MTQCHSQGADGLEWLLREEILVPCPPKGVRDNLSVNKSDIKLGEGREREVLGLGHLLFG